MDAQGVQDEQTVEAFGVQFRPIRRRCPGAWPASVEMAGASIR